MDRDEVLRRLPRFPKSGGEACDEAAPESAPAGPIDLTARGVASIRDPKVRRALESRFRELFPRFWATSLTDVLPRRGRAILDSSYGRELRVRLLPHNFYFKADVAVVRHVLGIADGHIGEDDWPEPESLDWLAQAEGGERLLGSMRRGQAASWWLDVHRAAANKQELPEEPPGVPDWLTASACASGGVDLTSPALPSWILREPDIPEPYASRFDLTVPLERMAARLVERYRLPWASVPAVEFHALTQDDDYLRNVSPFDVTVELTEGMLGSALRVTVDGLDEYTTPRQWAAVWRDHVEQRVNRLMEERGEKPRAKRPARGRLEGGMKLYRLARQPELREQALAERERRLRKKSAASRLDPTEVPGVAVEQALWILAEIEPNVPSRDAAYELVKDLDALMMPVK